LNSSVYRARVAFIIIFPFADCQLRDTFRGGKIILMNHIPGGEQWPQSESPRKAAVRASSNFAG
jgi:hypothetical protein